MTCSALAVAACASEVRVLGSESSSGGNGPNCPATPPTAYDQCRLVAGESCVYDVPCQSGLRSIRFQCLGEDFGFRVAEGQACTRPHDSCPGTELHCVSEWGMPLGTNPPTPCPDTPALEGGECSTLEMGGVRENCGYPCNGDPEQGWQVATCAGSRGALETGAWIYDDGCD
ncbi:MAG: hypothetical protein VB934_14655 [Polyangiaceae bacterium]